MSWRPSWSQPLILYSAFTATRKIFLSPTFFALTNVIHWQNVCIETTDSQLVRPEGIADTAVIRFDHYCSSQVTIHGYLHSIMQWVVSLLTSSPPLTTGYSSCLQFKYQQRGISLECCESMLLDGKSTAAFHWLLCIAESVGKETAPPGVLIVSFTQICRVKVKVIHSVWEGMMIQPSSHALTS